MAFLKTQRPGSVLQVMRPDHRDRDERVPRIRTKTMKRFAIAVALFVGVVAIGVAADDNEKALKDLQGEYTVKSLTKGGESAPEEVIKSIEDLKIKDDHFSLKVMGEAKTAKIKLDVSKKPAHFDLTPQDGPEKDKTKQGLYKYEKGELTIVL